MSINDLTFKGHTSSVYSVAFSPDCQTLATGSYDTTAILWNAATGEPLRILKGHNYTVWSVKFLPDGCFLATGSEDKTVRLWNIRSKITNGDGLNAEKKESQGVLLFEGHQGPVYSVAVSSDGNYIASGSEDKTAKLWHIPSWAEI
eukprot:10939066-Ditylum_brightwellii.AAC.1